MTRYATPRGAVRSASRSAIRSITGAGMDPDAAAYIAAVKDAGASVSNTQATEIHTKITKWKSEGTWLKLGWIGFPVWNLQAANAIDMRSRLVGTFNGAVTPAAGYVQGDGSTGWFDTSFSLLSIGTTEDATIGVLNYSAYGGGNRIGLGSGTPAATGVRVGCTGSASQPLANWLGANANLGSVGTAGVLVAARKGGTTYCGRRNAAGYSEATNAAALTGSFANLDFAFLANRTGAGTAGAFTQNQTGAGFIGTDFDASLRESFSADLKELWETCTGLTLP